MSFVSLSSRLFWLLLAVVFPAAAGLPEPVLQALKSAAVPPAAVSVFVQRVDQRKALISHEAERAMNPASTMKLLTTYAGLELLGPAYVWRTEALAGGVLQGDILDGDLVLKGYGDPALTLENFWVLLRGVRQKGVREIRGDLVLDKGYFEAMSHDPGAFDGEPYRAYNAGPDALLVNFKATRFTFSGDVEGGKVRVVADPDLPQLRVENRLELRQVPCADWKDRLGYQVRRTAGVVTVEFSGNYSVACGEKTLDLSVLDDSTYVYQLFQRLWAELGGEFDGQLRSGSSGETARRLLQVNSLPLADVIRLINKYSNNVMARQLLLTLGAERYGPPGSVDSGRRALHEWLQGKGLDFPELVVENGAGLSRNERISARHLGELLMAAYASPVMPELMSSLPVVAVDGTLQQRMKQSAVAGRGHFKTGSINGSRAMAGYLLDAQGRRWVVVFMANHPAAASTKAAQDALLEYVYAQR